MKHIFTLATACMLLLSCSSNSSTETNEQPGINPESLPNVPLDTLKAAEETTAAKPDTATPQVKKRKGNTRGEVSHEFRKSGCATVIVVPGKSAGEDGLVLIPKNALPTEMDKDGLTIYFNYQQLRMPNPPGCVKGMPAEITDAEAE